MSFLSLTPFYEEPAVKIYCGDCRKITPLLPDFDLLLTDPPYGLRDKLQGGTWGKSFDGDYQIWDAAAPSEWVLQMLMSKTRWQIAWTNLDRNIRTFDSPRNPDGKRVHPTQKPVELMSWCFNQAPEIKTVLDPYMGSGTTLVAAKLRGIKAVGIEINEDYCKLAVARLAQGVLLPC